MKKREERNVVFGEPKTILGPIVNGSVRQEFIASHSRLRSILVRMATYKRTNSCTIVLSIVDKFQNTHVHKSVINANCLVDNAYHSFPVHNLKNSQPFMNYCI